MIEDDLIISAHDEVAIRQRLLLVAMGREPADLAIEVGRLLAVHANHWMENQEIVISGRRIAYVGPLGSYRGTVAKRVSYPQLSAVPGFGEVHKHIESTHLTPEYEAALVLPRGNTWTCEASHEFANVDGTRNTEFWQKARLAGSPLKIFIQPGSAVPPSAWEESGGYYGYDEQKQFLRDDLSVTGLDEVMDWPSVWDPDNPGYARMWGMIRATFEMRGVVEGHGSGLVDPHDISAFAAAGLSSDHEVWALDEAWDRLMRGLFTELRPFSYDAIIPGLIARGLKDWSNIAFTTDDRSASDTLRDGATDHNVRHAIHHGLSPEIAIQCATINPARHMRIDQWVGSITPGRYADIVLLDDVASISIAHVYADGRLVSKGKAFTAPIPAIDWPDWATRTMNIGRVLSADDFAIRAEPGRETMNAAVLRPFHWNEDFLTLQLPVVDGLVQRDPAQMITKWSLVDRYRGDGAVSAMFWTGCGPADPDTALACSVAHDSHNVWCIGSSDAAMAKAVNRLQEMNGGWVLVHHGEVVAHIHLEVAGLMTARRAEALDAEAQAFLARAAEVTWMYQPAAMNRWKPGFPEFLIFATLTCSPWRWVLVAPSERAPNGFVNVQTGETHKVVW
ncbi:adenine deaminase C-terminal domain-containing protein [Devosia sp. 63-57]|uniref:adenine deaminase n=1 Tax=Devosia sp. 63-57 TaxID=1895751 RepID=UPI0008686EB6|nr:adenine deaminase C-terminal domain-containing protein [Devosia sp. 63-57]ODT48078.1 MAG: adenosine deaminase [Pelagibacterium sp. SCN 63-126]ODU85728.1 MAG: adenosine deaminase [Pelagibacterium sp. SCN 63-17]OJX42213.1 MAG: adenosine deaminase [Devosia sp. 63-57]